jgi:hypothetical protein
MTSILGAVIRYLKAYFTSEAIPGAGPWGYGTWDLWRARLARYELYWAHYENTAYDEVHLWANQYKTQNSLYRSTRGIYNPAKRLGDFWATHLMGGTIDPAAGDGKSTPSCLPVLTRNEDLRAALSVLWRDSNLQVLKEMYCRLGAVLGDVGLRVVDDPEAGKVAVEVVHPATIEWVDRDHWGNIKAYIIHERRLDPQFDPSRLSPRLNPEDSRLYVDYTERCRLDEATGMVHYETLLNDKPYAWNGSVTKWAEPYGFVPMVVHQHLRMSPRTFWGWSELHAGHAKIRNVDDLAAIFHDQIRKCVFPKWFFTNLADPAKRNRTVEAASTPPTTSNPEPGRQELSALYAGNGGTATPMIFPLDIQFTSMEIQNALQDLERDYPELRFDRLRATGDASAKALREARKPAEAKVHAIRAGYDNRLVEIDKVAIVIAAMRGYPGYEAFRGVAFDSPELDHRIGTRSVFNQDPLDLIEEEDALWTAATKARAFECPQEVFLRRMDWTERQVQDFMAARQVEIAQALQVESARAQIAAQAKALAAPAPSGGNSG